jgi:hypothetical protein
MSESRQQEEKPSATSDAQAEYKLPFEFREDRLFELYMEQRKGYVQGARDAYQRFDQTIIALSGGSIVLSMNFMKDLGFRRESLCYLFWSWTCFLIASLCAFVSLLTSGEGDRERLAQLESLTNAGIADEGRANRLGLITVVLNYSALAFCIIGLLLIITFATYNLFAKGGQPWSNEHRPPPAAQPQRVLTSPQSRAAPPAKNR